jgi:hypothetical protein
MPAYRVLRKTFWSAAGPIKPGQLVELSPEVGDSFPGNLALVPPEAPAPAQAEPEQAEAKPPRRRGEK